MNIYIANFDTQWNDTQLEALFLTYGKVDSATVMMDGFTEKSRGCGYVQMPSDEEAALAIASLHQREINGLTLSVTQAPLPDERKGSYKVGNGGINPYRFKKN